MVDVVGLRFVNEGLNESLQGLQQHSRAVDRATQSMKVAANQSNENAKSLDRLNRDVLRAENEMRRLAQAMQRGAVTGAQFQGEVNRIAARLRNLGLDRAQAETMKFARAQADLARETQQAGNAIAQQSAQVQTAMRGQAAATMHASRAQNATGMAIQQVGYQVGDFLVQVQSGTSAFVAFGQQATQLVGILPLFGSFLGLSGTALIGLSAGLGIAIPLITAFGAAWARTEESSEAIARLNFNITALQPILEALRSVTVPIGNAIGAAVTFMADSFDRLVIIAGTAATFFAGKYVAGVIAAQLATASLAGALVFLRGALIRTGIGALIVGAGELVYQFTRLIQATGSFGAAMGQLGTVAGAVWQGIVDSGAAIPPALDGVWNLMKAGFLAALSGMATAFHDFVWGIASGLEGVPGFEPLTEGLMSAVRAADRTSGALMRASGEARAASKGAFSDASGAISAAFDPARAAVAALAETVSASERSTFSFGADAAGEADAGKTGSSSAGKSRDDYLAGLLAEAEYKRSIVGLDDDEMRRREILFELKKRDLLVNDALSEQQALMIEQIVQEEAQKRRLMETEQQRQQLMQTVESHIENAFMSFVDGSASVEDAFKGMLRNILLAIYQQEVAKPAASAVSTLFRGLLGFADGGAFNKGVEFFANGGVVGSPTMFQHSGGLGVMGEAGPEAIMPLKRGSDGKLGVQMQGGGGGDTINVHQYFQLSANGDDSVRRIVRQEAPRMAEMAKSAVVDAKRRGGSYGRSF